MFESIILIICFHSLLWRLYFWKQGAVPIFIQILGAFGAVIISVSTLALAHDHLVFALSLAGAHTIASMIFLLLCDGDDDTDEEYHPVDPVPSLDKEKEPIC